jgi:hypothetical protein
MYTLPPEASEAEFRDLLAYWQSKLVPGVLPGRQHVDPTELPARHLSQLVLLDVVQDAARRPPRRFRFRLAGTALSAITGRDMTGLYYDQVGATERLAPVLKALNMIVDHKVPVFLAGRLGIPVQDFVSVKRLGLPLAQDGHNVDMILVVWLAQRRSAAGLTLQELEMDAGEPIALEQT